MRILSFKAENFKRLSSVEITPKGNVIKITGKNAEGKSSILDAIWCACGGADIAPEKPIRDGEESALIELDLGELIIKRKFTEKSSMLTVENAEGAIFRSPQKVLDDLIGKLSFDPMHFMQMKDKDQFEMLAVHSGVDFTELDAERKTLFEERTNVNRDGKAKRAEVDAIVFDKDAPDEIVSVASLANDMSEANKKNADITALDGVINRTFEDIKSNEETLRALKEKLEELNQSLLRSKEAREEMKFINVSSIQEKIDHAEINNNLSRAKKSFNDQNSFLEQMLSDSRSLTGKIKAIDVQREKMIADSKLPVKGLSFGEDVVLFNGIPIKQASSAEQLKISAAIAMATNPKLKVIRVQDGSLLDSTSMKMLEEMADDKDFQFWVEQVDESGKVGIVIEDGSVKSDNQ